MAETIHTHRKVRIDDTQRPADDLPPSMLVELHVNDTATIAELCSHAEGDERDEFALSALRIGVLALKQARGQVDADAVRRESERLLEALDSRLNEHSTQVHERLTVSLKDYFDPKDGRFQERVERLIKQDGELESLLRRQIGTEDSQLSKTLAAHFGEQSPLMKLLSPDQSQGLLAALSETLEEQLASQRESVLEQFSLDNKDGALARFIGELTQRQGELSEELHTKIDDVVKEFSLDEDDSALSRLVRNVEGAQRTITREFSLDEETSALSRLKSMLEHTNKSIHSHLSLDEEDSALARLKRELLELMKEHRETNQEFQEEVKGALQAMVARKKESQRSTRHGLEFEDAVFENLQFEAQRLGDVATNTGDTTGQIKNCKVGDCLIELGPESAAPSARIVVEAKQKMGYQLAAAREEIETARKNRSAQIGLFVFSKQSAPENIEPLARYRNDVVVVWDAEDAMTDVYLRVGYTLCRALCVRRNDTSAGQTVDFTEVDKAILEVEKRAAGLEEMTKWTQTIQNNSEKILGKLRTTRKSLEKQAELLKEKTDALKEKFTNNAAGE